jgi:catechol 2,3-dioxygenase
MEPFTLPPETTLGHVHLLVADLPLQIGFYHEVLGFDVLESGAGSASLGHRPAHGESERLVLLRLDERPGAPRSRATTGLYHFAPRVPSRAHLAQVVRRLQESDTPVQGMVDHHTHEAVYLADPEGNGIELYADRPPERWPSWEELTTRGNAPLDVDSLFRESGPAADRPGLPPETAIGHVHLHVADLAESDEFYVQTLGLDLMGRFPGQAHFTSAGGYHHHLAYNIWAGRGASPPPAGSRGLRHFTLLLPTAGDLVRLLDRLAAGGHAVVETDEGFLAHDPSGNGVLLSSP